MAAKKVQRKDQIDEIIKCGKNPVYFINKYCKIRHPVKGIIPFNTYPFQDDCIGAFEKHRMNIVLKARQLGLSTVTAAYATWLALFHKDKTILVIATKMSTASQFLKKVKVMLEYLPVWLVLPEVTVTGTEIKFDNGSTVVAIPTSADAGRSMALSLLICDEAAWIQKMEDIWTGLSPTISEGGNVILLSTPNGMVGTGGLFYRLYSQACTGLNEFNPICLPWNVHPEHDQAWFTKETSNMSKKKIAQEYVCDFLTSGDTFLEPEEIEYLKFSILQPIEKQSVVDKHGTGNDRSIWVWKRPELTKKYVISADVARGNAHDYSTFHAIDIETCEVCVEYMGKIPPEKFSDVLIEYGKKYNDALLVVELNSFGYTVNAAIRDAKYPHVFYEKGKNDPFNFKPPDDGEVITPGFNTNGAVRLPMLTKLGELIRTKKLKIYSQRFYDQIQGFMWMGNKPQAAKDNFDDLVMSLAIGLWLVETSPVIDDNLADMTRALLNSTSIERRSSEHMPRMNEVSPLISPGMMNAQSAYKAHHVDNMRKQVVNRYSELTNFSWLYR